MRRNLIRINIGSWLPILDILKQKIKHRVINKCQCIILEHLVSTCTLSMVWIVYSSNPCYSITHIQLQPNKYHIPVKLYPRFLNFQPYTPYSWSFEYPRDNALHDDNNDNAIIKNMVRTQHIQQINIGFRAPAHIVTHKKSLNFQIHKFHKPKNI